MLSPADIILAVIIAISALVSLVRGAVREVFSLVNWGVALIIALSFGGKVSFLFDRWIENEIFLHMASYITLFAGSLLIGGLLIQMLVSLVKVSGLSGLDRSLGLVFGLSRGFVITMVLVVLMAPAFSEQLWWKQSLLIEEYMQFETQIKEFMELVINAVKEFLDL